MIEPSELEHKSSLELSNLMNEYEKKIQAAAEVEYQHNLELRAIRGKILDLRKTANDVESGLERSKNVRQKLESDHRVLKTIFFNNRNAGI